MKQRVNRNCEPNHLNDEKSETRNMSEVKEKGKNKNNIDS
jgi:hypothetical protein